VSPALPCCQAQQSFMPCRAPASRRCPHVAATTGGSHHKLRRDDGRTVIVPLHRKLARGRSTRSSARRACQPESSWHCSRIEWASNQLPATRNKGVVSGWLPLTSANPRRQVPMNLPADLGVQALWWRRRDSNPWPPACKVARAQRPAHLRLRRSRGSGEAI
jgi:hypothetical protein